MRLSDIELSVKLNKEIAQEAGALAGAYNPWANFRSVHLVVIEGLDLLMDLT
jgi:hypothetical protein